MRLIIGVPILFLLCTAFAFAQKTPSASIAIIIDDIGYRQHNDLLAISLPGKIAYAIMPHTPNARNMSRLAAQRGKLVLIHLSMQPLELENQRFLGPGALTQVMDKSEFMQTIDNNINSLPEAVGVNNHMGSLLTQSPNHMNWLMESLDKNTLFYLDSVTSDKSIANEVALEKNVPFLKRDIFLDNKKDINYIQSQFNELISMAKSNGYAIAIGHPHPETINVLRQNLGKIDEFGVRLVSLVDLLEENPEAKNIANLDGVYNNHNSIVLIHSNK